MLPSPLLFPGRTVTGTGILRRLAEESAVFGDRGVIVHGRAFGGACRDAVLGAFPAAASVAAFRHQGGEPTLDEVESLRAFLREQRPGWVAGIGGGSVLDLAKAAAGLLHAPEPVAAYQQGRSIPPATLPFIAAPTTAGSANSAVKSMCGRSIGWPRKQRKRTQAGTKRLNPGFMARFLLRTASIGRIAVR